MDQYMKAEITKQNIMFKSESWLIDLASPGEQSTRNARAAVLLAKTII